MIRRVIVELGRWLRRANASSRVERRMRGGRPRPRQAFAAATRRDLTSRWAALARPPHFALLVGSLLVGGLALMLVALLVAAS